MQSNRQTKQSNSAWRMRFSSCMETGILLRGTFATLLFAFALGLNAATGEIKNSACLECHSDKTLTTTNAAGTEISFFVDPAKPVLCAKCHREQSESYSGSAHGLALAQGEKSAATCSDCHDGHTVLPPTSPDSPLYFANLAKTCGACHQQVAAEVAESVHGKA